MQITASYERTIYETQKDGVIIGLYHVHGMDKTKVITGSMLPKIPNVKYNFNGEWVEHKKYGLQFRSDSFMEDLSDGDSIVKFLSSSLIKGIGKVMAQRIVDTFGEKTIEILDSDIEKVLTIKRFPKKKFNEFKESYMMQRGARETVMTLSKYGISVKSAIKAYEKFKTNISEIIEKRPYELCQVEGITFPVADRIGPNTKEYEENYDRFIACSYYVLSMNESGAFFKMIGGGNGSTGMEKDDFGKVMLQMLYKGHINGKFICDMTLKMLSEKKLVYVTKDNKNYFCIPYLFAMERESAKRVAELSKETVPEVKVNLDNTIFCDEQKEAIVSALSHRLSLIVGMPGTGKTTIINEIAKIYKQNNENNEMYFLAPTGRASARIKASLTVRGNVSTIHSCLKIGGEGEKDEEVELSHCLIVVDEMSMTDTRVFYKLMKAVKEDCTVVLCGDDEQLQSVDCGAVLRDLINCGMVPVTRLTRIYRQSAGNSLYENIYKIRNGQSDLMYDENFSFTEISDTKALEDKLVEVYLSAIKEYGIDNVMLISPFKRNDAGVFNLNNRIQALVNPYGNEIRSIYTIREKDLVMETKNDKENDVMNGDIGRVIKVYEEDGSKYVEVDFDGKTKTYDKENFDTLHLAYAFTVHKAQGNEAKVVITSCHSMHTVFLKRNMFYTAVSRASKKVMLYGEARAIKRAIETVDTNERFTTFKDLIKFFCGEFITMRTRNGNLSA